jgi:hypothetical protein
MKPEIIKKLIEEKYHDVDYGESIANEDKFTTNEIRSICRIAQYEGFELADAVNAIEWIRRQSFAPNGYGGWGNDDMNYSSIQLYELFLKQKHEK